MCMYLNTVTFQNKNIYPTYLQNFKVKFCDYFFKIKDSVIISTKKMIAENKGK